MKKALGNMRTTIIGAVVAVLVALGQVEGLEQYSGLLNALAGVVTAVGFILAKDAATGSPPGAKE